MSDEVNAYARRAYRKLISDIAFELIDEDRKKLVFLHELGGELSALDIFSQLEKKGLIGPAKVRNLESVLSDIHRSDLISKHVEPFVAKQSQNVNLQGHTGPPASPIAVSVNSSDPLNSSLRMQLSTPSQESSYNSSQHHFSYTRQNMSLPSFQGTPRSPTPIREESPDITASHSSDCTTSTTTGFDNPQISTDYEQRNHTPPLINYPPSKRQSSPCMHRKESITQTGLQASSTTSGSAPHPTARSLCSVEHYDNNQTRHTVSMAPHTLPTGSQHTHIESETTFTNRRIKKQGEHHQAPSVHDTEANCSLQKKRVTSQPASRMHCQDHFEPSSIHTGSLSQGAHSHQLDTVNIQDASSALREYKNSLSWKISTSMLIKKIRNKDCSPLLKNFTLPVRCRYGYQIRIDLKLCPYENKEKRSMSLIATITIPQKCSQRRLFIHSCESKYRLSTDITSEGMRIANSCCKEAMVAPSDNNELHETSIYFDDILSHDELLHHMFINLNVVLQLLLLGSRLPTPQVTFFDEDDFLGIDMRQ